MGKKIIVIGSPGSGKSTFARTLAKKTDIPLYHLDLLWHRPDKTTVSREEFDTGLGIILENDAWIIDGNYGRTLEMRLEKCDTVFLFDLPASVCLEGACARVGVPRDDMPWVEDELDPDFAEYIRAFPVEQLPAIYSMLEKHGEGVEKVIFHTRAEADEYLSRL